MKTNISSNDMLLKEFENLPRVSLIIPFCPEMKNKSTLVKLLDSATEKTEYQLLENYPEEEVIAVIKKLRELIKTVKCNKNEKNLAIFVSPVVKKYYYFTPSNIKKIRLPVLKK